MRIDFRQGIVRTSRANFLTLGGSGVSLTAQPDPTIITIAHGTSDYLFIEDRNTSNAWTGPFNNANDYWLYWDIDTMTGERTFGHTSLQPVNGTVAPVSPAVDQHWFDYGPDFVMKVWSGSRWVAKLRVFAGKLDNGILNSNPAGSQIGVTAVRRKAGTLIFDDAGLAVKRYDSMGRGRFITSEDTLATQSNNMVVTKLEDTVAFAKATTSIAKYACVSLRDENEIGTASQFDITRPCVGIAVEDMTIDETRAYKSFGFMTNPLWNWQVPMGTPLWVGTAGEITTTVPSLVSAQRIGYVVSRTRIFIDIQQQVLFTGSGSENLVPLAIDRVTGALRATNNLTVTGGNGSFGFYQFYRETPASTWTIEHNLNTDGIIVQVYDANGEQVIPASIQIVNQNTVVVSFGVALVTGFANVLSFASAPVTTTTTLPPSTTNVPSDPFITTYDFGSSVYTVGEPPQDWTVLPWDNGVTTLEVYNSIVDSDKVVLMAKTQNGDSPAVASEVNLVDDADVVLKVRVTGSTNTDASKINVWALVRGSGGANTQGFGYIAGLGTIAGQRELFAIEKLNASPGIGGQRLTSIVYPWSLDTWYNIRLRAEGTLLRAKVWPSTAPEPGMWNMSITDASFSNGYVGFGSSYESNMIEVQQVNIATDGSIAPPPA